MTSENQFKKIYIIIDFLSLLGAFQNLGLRVRKFSDIIELSNGNFLGWGIKA